MDNIFTKLFATGGAYYTDNSLIVKLTQKPVIDLIQTDFNLTLI